MLIQVVEIWIVHECGPGVEYYWGVACSSLIIYPDDGRLVQVAVDELAEFALGLLNLWLLWECHVKKGHLLYETKRFKRELHEPFLSASQEGGVEGLAEYVSAEEGESEKVINSIFFVLSFHLACS